MILATLAPRGTDGWGSGDFGAPRGNRTHKGVDYACYPETIIKSHVSGVCTKIGYPYSDDLTYRYVEVTDDTDRRHRWFYVSPLVVVGDIINNGAVIGAAQDIASRYRDPSKPPMLNHIHYEILLLDNSAVDPNEHI